GDFPVFTDAQLQCTRSGQVLEDFKGKSVFHFNLLKAQEWAKKRDKNREKATFENMKQVIKKVMATQPALRPLKITMTGKLARPGYTILKRIYETEPGILVPAMEFIPDKEKKGPPIVYLHGRGMKVAADAIEKRVQNGERVLALDLRGMGE